MKDSDNKVIQALVADLQPVPAATNIFLVAVLWLCASLIYVGFATLALGPLRPSALLQLIDHPRFAMQTLAGAGAVLCFTLSAFAQSVPGEKFKTLQFWAWALSALWLGQIVIDFEYAALTPSMLGKREHCTLEAYLFFAPPAIAAIWMQLRRFPLRPSYAAINVAIAAGMIPAIGMQLACMYEPGHILEFHVAPIVAEAIVVGIVIYVLGRFRARPGVGQR